MPAQCASLQQESASIPVHGCATLWHNGVSLLVVSHGAGIDSDPTCWTLPVVLPPLLCVQSMQPPAPVKEGDSRWVLGWQFAAGEYLQMSRDVFGDEGIQNVFMSPSLQGPAEGVSPALPGRDQTPQHVAVFSELLLDRLGGALLP